MPLVLDTGPIVAALNEGDPDHDRCRGLLEGGEDLVVLSTVLVEVDYWLVKLGGARVWADFADDLRAGAYRLEQLTLEDVARAAELEVTYQDLGLGLVDASVVALCERLGERKLATLDRRHFSVIRPRHTRHLELLPA